MKWLTNTVESAEPYLCWKCGAETVNVAELPEVDIRCPECGPVGVEFCNEGSSTLGTWIDTFEDLEAA